jgi:hypothetical protein
MERGTFVLLAVEQAIQRAVWILEMDGTVEILEPESRGSYLQNKLPMCLFSWSSMSSFSNYATCSKCKATPTILSWKSRNLLAVPSTFSHFLHAVDR